MEEEVKIEEIIKSKVKEIEVEGEKVYLKKDPLGWRIVNPYKNSDGSINWFNMILGSKRNALLLLFFLVLVGVFIFVYHNDITSLKAYYNTTCTSFRPILEAP